MRTDRWRYTEGTANDKTQMGVELYDHQLDPAENENLAVKPENQALLDQLAKQMGELVPPPRADQPQRSERKTGKPRAKQTGR